MTQHQYLSDEQREAIIEDLRNTEGFTGDVEDMAHAIIDAVLAAIAAYVAKGAEPVIGDGWRHLFAATLRKIKYEAATLADAQVLALEVLEAADKRMPAPLSEVKAEPSVPDFELWWADEFPHLTQAEAKAVWKARFTAARQASPQQGAAQSEAKAEAYLEPISAFRADQWWLPELEAMAQREGATLDQKRAVAVVRHMLKAASAPTVGGVPAGWKLVPEDSTPLIRSAIIRAVDAQENAWTWNAQAIWRDALAATPSSPAVEEASSAGAVAHDPRMTQYGGCPACGKKDCPAMACKRGGADMLGFGLSSIATPAPAPAVPAAGEQPVAWMLEGVGVNDSGSRSVHMREPKNVDARYWKVVPVYARPSAAGADEGKDAQEPTAAEYLEIARRTSGYNLLQHDQIPVFASKIFKLGRAARAGGETS